MLYEVYSAVLDGNYNKAVELLNIIIEKIASGKSITTSYFPDPETPIDSQKKSGDSKKRFPNFLPFFKSTDKETDLNQTSNPLKKYHHHLVKQILTKPQNLFDKITEDLKLEKPENKKYHLILHFLLQCLKLYDGETVGFNLYGLFGKAKPDNQIYLLTLLFSLENQFTTTNSNGSSSVNQMTTETTSQTPMQSQLTSTEEEKKLTKDATTESTSSTTQYQLYINAIVKAAEVGSYDELKTLRPSKFTLEKNDQKTLKSILDKLIEKYKNANLNDFSSYNYKLIATFIIRVLRRQSKKPKIQTDKSYAHNTSEFSSEEVEKSKKNLELIFRNKLVEKLGNKITISTKKQPLPSPPSDEDTTPTVIKEHII